MQQIEKRSTYTIDVIISFINFNIKKIISQILNCLKKLNNTKFKYQKLNIDKKIN